MTISKKQRKMLAFIEDFVEGNGYPPTHEEIRTGLKISSKSLVNYHLEALASAALINRSPNTTTWHSFGRRERNHSGAV